MQDNLLGSANIPPSLNPSQFHSRNSKLSYPTPLAYIVTHYVRQRQETISTEQTSPWNIIRSCTNKISLMFTLLKQHIKMIVLFLKDLKFSNMFRSNVWPSSGRYFFPLPQLLKINLSGLWWHACYTCCALCWCCCVLSLAWLLL